MTVPYQRPLPLPSLILRILLCGFWTAVFAMVVVVVRDWWILERLPLDIFADTWITLVIEFLVRWLGYSLSFYVYLRLKLTRPLAMALSSVVLTMVLWPVGVIGLDGLGITLHLDHIAQASGTGFESFIFAYFVEFATIIGVQVIGWAMLTMQRLPQRAG